MSQEEGPEKAGEKEFKKEGDIILVRGESGRLETRKLLGFTPDKGDAVVVKELERGSVRKIISRKEFFVLNFPGSDEMLDNLKEGIDNVSKRTIAGKALERRRDNELKRLRGIEDAFANGNLGPMREYFFGEMSDLGKRYGTEDRELGRRREELLKEIKQLEDELVELRKKHAESGSRTEKIRLTDDISTLGNLLAAVRGSFREVSTQLQRGHQDLDKLRTFVSILDSEMGKREEKRAA